MAKSKPPKKPAARASRSTRPARRSRPTARPTARPTRAPAKPAKPAAQAPAPAPSTQSTAIERVPAQQPPANAPEPQPTGWTNRQKAMAIGGGVLLLAVAGAVAFWPTGTAEAATRPPGPSGTGGSTRAPVTARPPGSTTAPAPGQVLSDGKPSPFHDSQLDSLGAPGEVGPVIAPHSSERSLTRTDVLHYQQELFDLGADVDAIDGVLGARTRQGIRDFQRSWNARPENARNQLGVDGILGPATRTAIDRAHATRDSGNNTGQTVYVSDEVINVTN